MTILLTDTDSIPGLKPSIIRNYTCGCWSTSAHIDVPGVHYPLGSLCTMRRKIGVKTWRNCCASTAAANKMYRIQAMALAIGNRSNHE
jgi:hypothetical protein